MKFYTVHPKQYVKLRIVATLIDYGIFWFFCYVFITTVGVHKEDGSYVVSGMPILMLPVCWLLYFVLTESSNQATPGHSICKLKVYKVDGQKPDFYDSFKRRICDPIDIFIYGLPALICIIKTPKHQRLGDMLANTVVVKVNDVEIREVEF